MCIEWRGEMCHFFDDMIRFAQEDFIKLDLCSHTWALPTAGSWYYAVRASQGFIFVKIKKKENLGKTSCRTQAHSYVVRKIPLSQSISKSEFNEKKFFFECHRVLAIYNLIVNVAVFSKHFMLVVFNSTNLES